MTDKEFKKLYFENTIKQLSELLNISTTAVRKRAKELNLSKPRGIRPFSMLVIEE